MSLDDDTVLPFQVFSAKKQNLKQYLDGVSDAIYIPIGFPFGLQTHAVAYVSQSYVITGLFTYNHV